MHDVLALLWNHYYSNEPRSGSSEVKAALLTLYTMPGKAWIPVLRLSDFLVALTLWQKVTNIGSDHTELLQAGVSICQEAREEQRTLLLQTSVQRYSSGQSNHVSKFCTRV